MPRIALVTARRAADAVRGAARRVEEATGWKVDVIVAPVEVAALIPREVLEEVLRGIRGRYDLVIVPGGLGYSLEGLEEAAGAPVVRGPQDLMGLELLAELGLEGLEELKRRGELSGELLLERWLGRLWEHYRAARGVELCGVKVPLRPPPVIVAAEVFVEPGHVEDAASKAAELVERGAHILVAGFGQGWRGDEAAEALDAIAAATGAVPLAVDAATLEAASAAVEWGACMLMSVGRWNLEWLDKLPRHVPVVLTAVDSSLSVPSSPTQRLELLRSLAGEALERGYRVVLDPIVDAPGFGSLGASVSAYFLVSLEMPEHPLLAGIANVYELLDADSHGQIAALTQVYAEAGASIMLVSEQSPKARMAVSEAAAAATMTSLSLLLHRPPKDLGVDLLYAKEKRPQPPPARRPRRPQRSIDAGRVAPWRPYRPDPVGSHVIALEDGAVVDYYIGRRGTVRLRGGRAEDIYKAIAYLGYASDPAHYAYLGYELCKAEHALRMKRSYQQEKPLLTPPWEKNRVLFNPRRPPGQG
ncbi:MAG: hypothetical protein GXO15_02190 [Crenarchaeota archaeon]|nr:hypothetical protein [Thermoproteota archaeon]